MLYTFKGDSRIELTKEGISQAKVAGQRLAQITPPDANVIVCISPFERTTQTLLALYSGGFDQSLVSKVHVDPQIREQEFGNFQDPGLTQKVRAEEGRVGRFYYRRPNAESSADVFDRVTQFFDKLFGPIGDDGGIGILTRAKSKYDMCLIVTHGLTIRLMLMCLFQWSVETFGTVWNLGNCEHVCLKKNMETFTYEICPEESFPQRVPWASREIFLVLRENLAPQDLIERLERLMDTRRHLADGSAGCREELAKLDKIIDGLENQMLRARSFPYTVINYLEISQPRTMQTIEVLGHLVPGHGHQKKTPEELEAMRDAPERQQVEFIDWWGDQLSYQGKMLRTNRITRGVSGRLTEKFPAFAQPRGPHSDRARMRIELSAVAPGAHDLVEAPESENGPAKPDPERVVGEEVASEGQGSGLTAPDPESILAEGLRKPQGDQTDDLQGQPAEVALAIWSEDTSLEEWQAKSFAELAEIVSKILADMATLSSQCDRLFLKSCHSVSGDSYLDVEKLHVLTQLLIDRFGCRSSGTLERIGQVYGAVTAGRDETGLSSLEFQGYTAAVLTQLLQDLESQIASGDLPESRADPQGGLMETLQDWISQLTSALE
ncbi:unnamed protein product [Effrenium voratum]|nr:unnamed protein product [Effrenium voratum]